MNQRSLITFVVIVGVLGLAVFGWSFVSKKTTTPTTTTEIPSAGEEATPASAVGSITANKVVKHISKSVSGTVKSVSGQTIVLEEDGDTLSIEVTPEATITKVTLPSPTALPEESGTAPTRAKISLAQVRVGDKVDALLVSQPDGSFLANDVTVLVETE